MRQRAIWPFFFISGASLATWSTDIPAVRDRLDLSPVTMGGLVLLLGISSVSFGLASGRVLTVAGSVPLVRIGAVLTPLSATMVFIAPSLPTIALALLLFGATYAVFDVSMNAHGVAVETASGTAVMSSLHGGWSIGGLAGAGGVAFGHILGIDYRLEAVVVLLALALGGLFLGALLDSETSGMSPRPPVEGSGGAIVLPVGSVVVFGLLAMLLYSVEGTALDWGSSYVQSVSGTAALGAAAVAALSAGMAAGRLVGDRGNRRLGPARLLQVGMASSALALAAMVAIGAPILAVPALFVTGLGIANSAPLLLSAAGRSGDMAPGAAIAATTMMGNFGLLFISPVLGAMAQFGGFSVTMICAAILAGLGFVGVRRVRSEIGGNVEGSGSQM